MSSNWTDRIKAIAQEKAQGQAAGKVNPSCPKPVDNVLPCPRYKLVVSAAICERCKSDPEFKQSLFAAYVRNRAARALPCRHQSERIAVKHVKCCGGQKTANVGEYKCAWRAGRVTDPDCWLCADYQPKEAQANVRKPHRPEQAVTEVTANRQVRVLNARLMPKVQTIPAAKPEVHLFDLHGEHVVFDANSLCAVHANERTARDIHREARKAFGGMLFSRRKPQFRLARSTPVRRVVLNVTHACNLACVYCFAGGSRPEPAMTVETARKAIEMIDPRSTVDVAFFGGEPLLAWDLIRRVMDAAQRLAEKRKTRAKFHITTNALLLDEKKVAFLSEQPCSILISLDGPEKIHNASRPALDSHENSFKRTMASIKAAHGTEMGRRIMTRATFDASEPQLVRRLELFAGLQEAGLINGFSVEPAVLGEGCAGRGGRLNRHAIAREYHAAAEWYVGRIRAGKSAGFFHFRKLIERIRNAAHSGSECGAGNGYITVGTDGSIYACHREAGTQVGHVDYGFDEELRAAWADNRVYARNGCMKCWARYLCGGGCRQACLELAGDLRAPVPERCFLQQTMLRECLWILTQLDATPAQQETRNE